jgi:hypothetical protein
MMEDHYCSTLDAQVSIAGLEQIGWFRKKIELISKDAKEFVKFFSPKTKEPIHEDDVEKK